MGMPGCRQYVSLDLSVGLPVFGTQATTSISIPTGSAWTGFHFYATAASLTPGVNQSSALSAKGIDLRIDIN